MFGQTAWSCMHWAAWQRGCSGGCPAGKGLYSGSLGALKIFRQVLHVISDHSLEYKLESGERLETVNAKDTWMPGLRGTGPGRWTWVHISMTEK